MSRFLLNDASLHGQFASLQNFLAALASVFQIRDAIKRSGFRLEVNRSLSGRLVIGSQNLREALGRENNPENKRRLLAWIDKDGPFWDDPSVHSFGEYFECKGELVTETAIAEACCLTALGTASSLISLSPSRFCENPLEVFWRGRGDGDKSWNVLNFYATNDLQLYLEKIERPPASWQELLVWVSANCSSLILSPDVLSQLPTTFYPAAAQRAQVLLLALNSINTALQRGEGAKFENLRRLWMEGDKARMTDSSDAEKAEFGSEMTFQHPGTLRMINCTWHAKIKTPQFRIHFEWPKADQSSPLFIGYFGPKITKR